MTKHLNIIAFDIPYPANYGGVIDVFYKLKALKEQGFKIYLHCFEYGRSHAAELNEWCEEVSYYKRKTGLASHLSILPYTVKSRSSKELIKNLLKNDAPILCEVLHTCSIFNLPEFKNRFKIYRHSNIEHHYYKGLAKAESNFIKKLFLTVEAFKLKQFEKIVAKANLILAVNSIDTAYFKDKYPQVKTEYLPSFHENEQVQIKEGLGEYILFHGNLSISENSEAAEWLIRHVFSKLTLPVIIAGLSPKNNLVALCNIHSHIKLKANPSSDEMQTLIINAQQHVLYTNQGTGLKLKLLNVLYSGRHVVCNTPMLNGSGVCVNSSIEVANTAQEMISVILKNSSKPFTKAQEADRHKICQPFNNEANAQKIVSFLASF